MNQYEVTLKSVPGFSAQYSGSLKVWAESEDGAVEEALRRMTSGIWQDKSRSCWRVIEVVRIYR